MAMVHLLNRSDLNFNLKKVYENVQKSDNHCLETEKKREGG